MQAPPYPGKGAILSKVGGGTGNNGYQYGLVGNNAQVFCQFNAQGEPWPTNQLIATVTGGIPLNTWTHIACTYDYANLKIYVNGSQIGTLAVGAKSVVNSASNLRISSDDNGNVFFDGLIDEAQIWDRALTEDEIYDIINEGSGCAGKPSKPVLVSPAHNGNTTKTKVPLDWDDKPCATSYKVVVKDTTTGSKVFKETVAVSNTKTTTLTKGKTYKWFVRACNNAGCGKKSSKFKFTIN